MQIEVSLTYRELINVDDNMNEDEIYQYIKDNIPKELSIGMLDEVIWDYY